MFPFTTSRIIASDPNEKKKVACILSNFLSTDIPLLKCDRECLNKLIDQKVFVWFCVKFDSRFIQIQDIFSLISVFLCIFKAILNEGSQSIMSFI